MLNVVFVNYGAFDNNSGNHIANFANQLTMFGHSSTVIASGNPDKIEKFHSPLFECIPLEDITYSIPYSLRKILNRPNTLIHCWTPRQICETTVLKLIEKTNIPYFIHFEDNESEITLINLFGADYSEKDMRSIKMDTEIPIHLTHPLRAINFIEKAKGVTGIVRALQKLVPAICPFHLLEPGVDTTKFCSDLNPEQVSFIRRYLYIPDDHIVVVYPGNMHHSNQRDMFSLYLAMYILKRKGRKVTLIRTGTDFVPHLDISIKEVRKANIIELGQLPYGDLLAVLKIADLFVQPGKPDRFNEHRLPSKIPEFLSLGRPTILPNTNIGLKMVNRQDAILMDTGNAQEIVSAIEAVIDNPNLKQKLGRSARKFAELDLNWKDKARGLIEFYHSTCNL